MARPVLMTLALTALTALAGCGQSDPAAPVEATSALAPTKTAAAVDPAIKSVYAAQCVTCHGETGAGDGNMVAMLKIKPRSFGADEWRFVDFAADDDAVRAEIARVIRDGIADAMMPGYADKHSDDQITALVDYVLRLRRSARGE